MAEAVTIGGGGTLFVGEDKSFVLEVLDSDDVPVNIAGWAITFDVRADDFAASALLSVTATVSGTYNATRSVNTQRATATLTDTQTGTLIGFARYRYSFKRTDDGTECILAYGDFLPERATQV